jgi:general secretion pathway protein K
MRRACRGAALVLILWLVAMLAALVANFAIVARVEMLQAGIGDRGGLARQHARAGMEYAVAVLLANPDAGLDGRLLRWSYQGSELELRIRDESGKVDLNLAPPELLVALLEASGLAPGQAAGLAQAIVVQRARPLGAFVAVEELKNFPGLDADAYARLAEDLTVHSGTPLPAAAVASATVRAALLAHAARTGQAMPGGGAGGLTYSIDSRVMSAAGGRAHARGIVRLEASADPAMAYSLLGWEEGDSVQ